MAGWSSRLYVVSSPTDALCGLAAGLLPTVGCSHFEDGWSQEPTVHKASKADIGL